MKGRTTMQYCFLSSLIFILLPNYSIASTIRLQCDARLQMWSPFYADQQINGFYVVVERPHVRVSNLAHVNVRLLIDRENDSEILGKSGRTTVHINRLNGEITFAESVISAGQERLALLAQGKCRPARPLF
jgi:hypothetical protein